MLELVAVNVDRDVPAAEELQAARVVEVQVRQHDSPDVVQSDAGRG